MTDQLGTLQALSSTRWGLVLPLDVAYSSSKSHWFNSLQHLQGEKQTNRSIQGGNKPTWSGEKQMSQYFTAYTRENTTRTKFYSFKRENTMMMFYSINWGKTINQINALQHLLGGKTPGQCCTTLIGVKSTRSIKLLPDRVLRQSSKVKLSIIRNGRG